MLLLVGERLVRVNGALSIMLGGPKKKLLQINNLMDSYAKNIVHIGPSGHGQLTKMVNQLCIGSLIQGLSEGVALGKKSNLNMTKVLDAISGGAAQSWQMDNRFKTMVNGEFDFGFAVDLMIKDLKIALDHSKDLGIKLPSTKSVLQNYKKLSTLGDGQLDTSSLIKLLEKANEPDRFARVIASNTSLMALGRGFLNDLRSFVMGPIFKLTIWLQGPATWEEFVGGNGFTSWIRYSRYTDNIDVGGVMQTLGSVSDAEKAAYEAPYPNATYKAGAQIFPYLIPSELRKNEKLLERF